MATISNYGGRVPKKSLEHCYISTINGIPRMSSKPANKPSAETLARREKFKLCGLFSKTAASIPEIKQIWKNHRPDGFSAFHLLVGANYQLISSAGPTIGNMITPAGFVLPVVQINMGELALTLSLSELNTSFSPSGTETGLSVIVLFACTEPVRRSSPRSKMISLSKRIPDYEFSKPALIQFDYNVQHREIFRQFRKKVVYVAAAAINREGKVGRFSSTYSSII